MLVSLPISLGLFPVSEFPSLPVTPFFPVTQPSPETRFHRRPHQTNFPQSRNSFGIGQPRFNALINRRFLRRERIDLLSSRNPAWINTVRTTAKDK